MKRLIDCVVRGWFLKIIYIPALISLFTEWKAVYWYTVAVCRLICFSELQFAVRRDLAVSLCAGWQQACSECLLTHVVDLLSLFLLESLSYYELLSSGLLSQLLLSYKLFAFCHLFCFSLISWSQHVLHLICTSVNHYFTICVFCLVSSREDGDVRPSNTLFQSETSQQLQLRFPWNVLFHAPVLIILVHCWSFH